MNLKEIFMTWKYLRYIILGYKDIGIRKYVQLQITKSSAVPGGDIVNFPPSLMENQNNDSQVSAPKAAPLECPYLKFYPAVVFCSSVGEG